MAEVSDGSTWERYATGESHVVSYPDQGERQAFYRAAPSLSAVAVRE